jgi:hypothetical protein
VTPKHYLDVAGDAAEDVELKPEFLASLSRLARETGAYTHPGIMKPTTFS